MDPQFLGLVAMLGLTTSVGLNTTLPLLLVGLGHDFGLITLAAPYDALGHPIALLALAALASAEMLGDKIPGIDTLLHTVQTPLTLAAGALVAGTQAGAIQSVHPALVIILGAVIAGGTHIARSTVRPLAHVVSLGHAALPISLLEDVAATLLVAISLIAPLLVPVVLLALVVAWVAVIAVLVRSAARIGAKLVAGAGGMVRHLWSQGADVINARLSSHASRALPYPSPDRYRREEQLALPTGTPVPRTEAEIWDI